MFHKTIHKAWNLFKLSKQSPENSTEKSWFSISRVLFSIGRTGIKQQSRHPETPRFFLYHFNWSSQSFDQSKMLNFEFSLKKFQNLNFYFMKQYSPNSNIIITTYPYIYIYIYIYNIHHYHLRGWRKRLAMHLCVSQQFTKSSKQRNMASLQDWNKLWC